jgi:hypothetical protein
MTSPDPSLTSENFQVARRAFLGACAVTPLFTGLMAHAAGATEASGMTPYLRRADEGLMSFGSHSHFLQPWRSYGDTVPAAHFLRGVGIVLEQGPATDIRALQALADSGFATVRIEISWSLLDYVTEKVRDANDAITDLLRRCHRIGLRPLLLLNGHQGLPVPALQFPGRVLAQAQAGDRTIRVSTDGDIVLGRTGLSNLTGFWAAENLVTGVRGDRLELSKPLPSRIDAGAEVRLTTLKYEPFGVPHSDRTNSTLDGWARYVDAVAEFATSGLGTQQESDKGFDLEIWNELSFGSNFLSIANYYTNPPEQTTDESAIWAAIADRTAAWYTAHPDRVSGVRLVNGFGSTVPWIAAAEQPPAISGISKHPYPPALTFPRDEQKNSPALDANGSRIDWAPSYRAYFPEYFATGIQTETIIRDMGPYPNQIYGHWHGRTARKNLPVPVWITEIGANPSENGILDPGRAWSVKGLSLARTLLFYLNKGAERVYIYSATGPALEYGVLNERRGVAPIQSPAMVLIARIVAVMRQDHDPYLSHTTGLAFRLASAQASAMQFGGDPATGEPGVRNMDMLALLPFQVSSARHVVAYYFVTRDILVAATAESVDLMICNLPDVPLVISSYDPMSDTWSGVEHTCAGDGVRLSLLVSDTPRLLLIEQSPA